MKKLQTLFALMLVCIGQAFAYDFEVNGIYYDISGSNATVTDGSKSYSGIVVIPATVTYKSVTYSVTSIGYNAFGWDYGLTSITIPNSVTYIGRSAFERCTGLTSITIPNSVTSIEEDAFLHCSSLTSVTIPNSVTSIGRNAFSYCTGLTSVTIGSSVESIGSWAFHDCSGLTSVTIPNSVTSIGDSAFNGCSGLTSVTVESGNTHYDSRDNCNAIIETASNTLIAGCKSTIIPNSVTSIGDRAFDGCSGLTSVTIPNSVTSIGEVAFDGCSGLTSIIVESGNTHFDSRDNCNAIIETASNTLITGCKNTTIPNSVTSIGYGAFERCTGLTSITIPNSVTSIGDHAFRSCSGLTSIIIPNSVTSIGFRAFYDCSGLTSVTIPNSVTSIESNAFLYCTNVEHLHYDSNDVQPSEFGTKLKTVVIGSSVTYIRERAFSGCTDLTTITIKATTPPTCEMDAFFNFRGDTLIVPRGCVFTYKKADGWRDFETITDGEVQFPEIRIIRIARNQSTITLNLEYNKEKSVPFEEIGVKMEGTYYKANSEGIVKLENLYPDREYDVDVYAKYGGEYCLLDHFSYSTKAINPRIATSDIMANKALIRGSYDKGDAHIYKTTLMVRRGNNNYEIKEQECKNDKLILTGLTPNTKYSITYSVYYHYGVGDKYNSSVDVTKDFTTPELKMKTLNPRNVSSTSSVVAAEANISDEETGAGFEWRKYDAPESLPSSKGSAIVYGGRMEGKINNLQPVYYKVRPYYECASGKVFYGEWTTFDPTDFSFFEPTVHTYDIIEDPSSNFVEVRGYVMQGTDAVTEQGFEYWQTGGSSRRQIASNGEVMRVQATGQMMIATLKDLDYESAYVVRAYVMTASGTVYGEERTFTTPANPTSAINEVKESESINRSLKGIYTLDGRKIDCITTPGIYLYNGRKRMFKASQLPVE